MLIFLDLNLKFKW